MDVEVKIDAGQQEMRIVIYAPALTDEVTGLVRRLGGEAPAFIAGYRDGLVSLLAHDDIVRVFTETPRVNVQTVQGTYGVKNRLYEIEAMLDSRQFVRISNTDLVNLKKIKHLDVSLSGTIRVSLEGGIEAFVSRRYMAGIKQRLGL